MSTVEQPFQVRVRLGISHSYDISHMVILEVVLCLIHIQ